MANAREKAIKFGIARFWLWKPTSVYPFASIESLKTAMESRK